VHTTAAGGATAIRGASGTGSTSTRIRPTLDCRLKLDQLGRPAGPNGLVFHREGTFMIIRNIGGDPPDNSGADTIPSNRHERIRT
jgi:hypothetical protein